MVTLFFLYFYTFIIISFLRKSCALSLFILFDYLLHSYGIMNVYFVL